MLRILMGLAGGVPVMVLAVALYVQRWRRKSAGHRLPTEEKLLRPAGYSLSKEIEELTQGYQDMLFIAFMCALVATGALAAPAAGGPDQLVLLALFGGACAVLAVMAWRNLEV